MPEPLENLAAFAAAITGPSVGIKTEAGVIPLTPEDISTVIEEVTGHRALQAETDAELQGLRTFAAAIEAYVVSLQEAESAGASMAPIAGVIEVLTQTLTGEAESHDPALVATVLAQLRQFAPDAPQERAEAVLDAIEGFLSGADRADALDYVDTDVLNQSDVPESTLPIPTPNPHVREVDAAAFLGAERDSSGRINMGSL